MAKLVDTETGQVVFQQVVVADTFLTRAVGLLGRTSLAGDEAMFIRPCTSIHTCFMRMNINVAFCNSEGTILKVISDVRPWRLHFGPRGSRSVLEWSVDSQTAIQAGQRFRLE